MPFSHHLSLQIVDVDLSLYCSTIVIPPMLIGFAHLRCDHELEPFLPTLFKYFFRQDLCALVAIK